MEVKFMMTVTLLRQKEELEKEGSASLRRKPKKVKVITMNVT